MSFLWPAFLVPALLAAGPAVSGGTTFCDAAAIAAARETGVPAEILLALTRTETGRESDGTLQPWPWVVNQAGLAHWFADRPSAVAYVEAAVDDKVSNIDIGCFQLNYRWHGQAFASVDDMFEPRWNALYAARFLMDLFSETGDWRLAAGAFHSRRPEDAATYLDRFDLVLASLTEGTAPEPDGKAPTERRVNAFPLLSGGVGIGGSLVPARDLRLAPLPASAGRPLFGP